jgi:hypothetical protein
MICACRMAVKEVFLPYFDKGKVLLRDPWNTSLIISSGDSKDDCPWYNLCSLHSVVTSSVFQYLWIEIIGRKAWSSRCILSFCNLKLQLCLSTGFWLTLPGSLFIASYLVPKFEHVSLQHVSCLPSPGASLSNQGWGKYVIRLWLVWAWD